MKKIISAAFVFLIVSILYAEGLNINGYFRTGLMMNIDDSEAQVQVINDGKYYGIASSRLRLNLNYDTDNSGVTFRYQVNNFSYSPEVWFDSSNIKWAMGRVNFCNGLFGVQGGKLVDQDTSSGGYEGYNFCDYYGTYGMRFIIQPADGLSFSLQGASLYADKITDNDKDTNRFDANEKIVSISAKYENDYFSFAAGYHFAGEAYAFCGLNALKNFTCNIEMDWLSDDIADNERLIIDEDLNYLFGDSGFEAGILAYQNLSEENVFEFYPHLRYLIVPSVRASFETGFIIDKDDDNSLFFITPALEFYGSRSVVRLFFTYEDDDICYIGATVKISF